MFDDLALTPADATGGEIRLATVAAQSVAIDAVYREWHRDGALLWDPPSGRKAVAAGTLAELRASGTQRMARLQQASRRLWGRLRGARAAASPAPRLWGGFAFAPASADRAPWQDFGDASFVLPRLTYWRDGGDAWLQAAADSDEALERELATASASIARLAAGGEPPGAEPLRVPAATIAAPAAGEWQRQVDGILQAIGTDRVRKVVAARCAKVEFERPPSVAVVLANLRREAGQVWRFALTRGGATFLGATPELLVRRCGDDVETEALAGTLAKCDGGGEDLLASAKERREHEFVRDGIVEVLTPLCRELQVPPAPVVREMRRLYHLATPIRGRLLRPTHVLELCQRLHPTAATCGTPRPRALQMILSTESAPRGWYAAPLGWFDARGDGELVVALRSGLLAGRTAYVPAGAGIVAGSRADRELAETMLKQRVLLRALGVGEEADEG